MSAHAEKLALAAFHQAAERVPAYRIVLEEAKVRAADIRHPADFARVPILEKRDTFQRFDLADLCLDGRLGPLASVLTSSGHSGVFAFGLTARNAVPAAKWTDDLLDPLFHIRSRPTLLINCLPMGVKIATHACTLAETSVRPDMAVGLVQAFARHFAQIILVGETAFIKHLLELGRKAGVDWRGLLVHVIVGEEPLPENGRKYLEGILGIDLHRGDKGMVISSMGIAEIGLNLFFEAPPARPLVLLRRFLHENAAARQLVFGSMDWVPCLFTYDPRRVFVEFDVTGRLTLTTLDPSLRLPLIRYASGDRGRFLRIADELWPALEAAGASRAELESLPLVAISGRGRFALAGRVPVHPEAVKEGIYHDPALAGLTTANFRLLSHAERARVRIQLAPGIVPDTATTQKFSFAISQYVRAPLEVTCESYEDFGNGMSLDYERKFDYLELDR
jgi:phenylacetate-CoA ligase